MASHWHSFEPAKIFPAPLQRAVSGLDRATSLASRAGKVVTKALNVLAVRARSASVNPAETALRAALAEIDRFIAGITGGTQVHMVIIPIRKKVLTTAPKGALEAVSDFLDPSEPASTLIARAQSSIAGPGAFLRTLIATTADAGDPARPQFPATFATAGVCLVAGGETLSSLAVPIRLFSSLFGGNVRLAPAANVLPVVQNLRVRTLAVPGGVGAILSWAALSPVRTVPLYVDDVMVAKEIFVIRLTDPPTRGYGTWTDLFPNEEPTDDPENMPDKAPAKVIARLRNHGFVVSYTDSALLDPKKTYYYTTCVRYTVDGVVQPMGALSNVVRVTRTAPQPSTARAVPPDWYATDNLAHLMPILEQTLNQVRLGVSRLGSRTTNNSGAQQTLRQTIALLERQVAQWEATNRELADVAERLQAITALGNAASQVTATVITRGDGGVSGWMAELARRMSDEDDSSRPTLSDQSTVIGVVILAGAPRLPNLSPLIALLNLFFGNVGSNPLLDVARQFGPDAARIDTAPTPGVTGRPVLGYDAAMRPSPEPTC